MKIVNITVEQREELCKELARLVLHFKKDERTKGIYFILLGGLRKIDGNFLEFTLVSSKNGKEFREMLQEMNFAYQENEAISKYGFRIVVNVDEMGKYVINDLNPSECRRSNRLMNATILDDEMGILVKIKEQTMDFVKNNGESLVYHYYDNLVEVFPTISDVLNRELGAIRDREDTEAVKEFTRSRLFQKLREL